MPRPARMVLPGVPHHVLQRGNRKQALFFDDGDRRAYLKLLSLACAKHGTACLAWCLMDNHVHLILVPATEDGLRAPLASVHTAHSQRINRARGLSGHLFQGRFASYAMDDAHLMVAARYVENNPVAAGLVPRAEAWPWSSARAHVDRRPDGLTDIAALGVHLPNWRAMLARGLEAGDEGRVASALQSGRPLANEAWLRALADLLGRSCAPARRGRPPRRNRAGPSRKGDCPLFRIETVGGSRRRGYPKRIGGKMLALIKTIVLAVAALLAAAALCALFVLVYPAFGFPLFALAAAELIWLIVALLAIPMALLDRQREWQAMALVPLSLILMAVYNAFILSLAASRNLALDEFTASIIGVTGRAVQYLSPPLSGPIPTASIGLVCGVLAALLLRAR